MRILQNYRTDYQTLKSLLAKAQSRPQDRLKMQINEIDKKIKRQRKLNETLDQ